MGLAEDAEDTLNSATNQHFNRQRNTGSSQIKCFMREAYSKVFRRQVENLEKDILLGKAPGKR